MLGDDQARHLLQHFARAGDRAAVELRARDDPAQLNSRPVTRPGEVLEEVPGLIVTQHSGEGKANPVMRAPPMPVTPPT
jgi:hypothetical protein